MNRFRFVPNVPQIVSLQSPEGDYTADTDQVTYKLSDGRELILYNREATRLNLLDLKPAETFGICQRWDGIDGRTAHIDMWLTPQTEQARAEAERIAADSRTDPPAIQKPRRTRKVHEMPPPPAPETQAEQGTGTHGPAPLPRPAIAARAAAVRIPFNVAFREITQFVTAELKAAGEQWDDDARQGMISTVLIASAKSGFLTIWER
jgi:hypothetical protein